MRIYYYLMYSAVCGLLLSSCAKEKSSYSVDPEDKVETESKTIGDTIIHKLRINGNDTYVNEIKGIYFFADDLKISKEQFNILKRADLTRQRSVIPEDFITTWPNSTVYYKLPQGTTSIQLTRYQQSVKSAMSMISSETNIRFVERTTQPEYIEFVWGLTNSSPLGWTKNRVNTIEIIDQNIPGVIAHEILHSLGVLHEMNSPNRDKYIKILWENIAETMRNNFTIYPGYKAHGDFDFASLMLYGSFAGGIDQKKATMTKLDGTIFSDNRYALSKGDYAGLNALYPNPPKSGGITFIVDTYENAGAVNSFNGKIFSISNNAAAASTAMYHAQRHYPPTVANRENVDGQKFLIKIEPSSSDMAGYKPVYIKSTLDTNYVLTVPDYSTELGRSLEFETMKGGKNQQFYLNHQGNGVYTLQCKFNTGYSVELKGTKFLLAQSPVFATDVTDRKGLQFTFGVYK